MSTPFRRVVDDLTNGCGCACHTGTGYNTACRHCQPQMYPSERSAGAAPLDVEGIDDAILYAIAFMNDPDGLAACREEWRDKLRAALHTLRERNAGAAPDAEAFREALARCVEALGFVAVNVSWDNVQEGVESMVAEALYPARALLLLADKAGKTEHDWSFGHPYGRVDVRSRRR